MNFKEALIAHLQGEKVEVKGFLTNDDWGSFGKLSENIRIGYAVKDECGVAYQYRIVPRTITVNGVEVPVPEKEVPNHGDKVFVADPCNKDLYYPITWCGIEGNYMAMNRNLVYLNKEDAIARAKAMLIYKEA